MLTSGFSNIFLDEFTCFPYEYLASIVYNNAAEDLYLVGDLKQTCVKEPNEGIYIGNRIKLEVYPTHSLLVNFRNPPDTVALLNKLYGYKMRSGKQI